MKNPITNQELDRNDVVCVLADIITNAASQKELCQLYYDNQYGYLDDLTDDELYKHYITYLEETSND